MAKKTTQRPEHDPRLEAGLVRTFTPATGVQLVVLDIDTLRGILRELLTEMLSTPALPDFYSQTCLPPGMTRRSFLDAIRRGDLPARASGKIRFVRRADFQTFVQKAPLVHVNQAATDDIRALVRKAQGKK